MKRLALVLLLGAATPAFAAGDGEVTVLRGTSATPTNWYEPPPPPPKSPPQPVVIYQSVIYPQPFYGLPSYTQPVHQHRLPNGWPLLRR